MPNKFDVVSEETKVLEPTPRPAGDERRGNPEAIQRIEVDPEDRLAFRVGVNILTLALIALGVWLLWRAFWG
jgi:hypothetical protein